MDFILDGIGNPLEDFTWGNGEICLTFSKIPGAALGKSMAAGPDGCRLPALRSWRGVKGE